MAGTFVLKSSHKPAGDQPEAIKKLLKGLEDGCNHQTLLGVTGSGKTFTAANVIAAVQKPTLVIAHNKTLAAQLAQEYREFFPDNAVHYFVSYYDFYQPEAYLPASDTYIEKDAQINEEINRLRHASTSALLTRRDVIVVASVSCIYGLGSPAEYEKENLKLSVGMRISRSELLRKLIAVFFERTSADLTPGTFRSVGNTVEVMPAAEKTMFRLEIGPFGIERILEIDPVTSVINKTHEAIFLFPAKHFITPKDEMARAMKEIKAELAGQLKKFQKEGKILEADRLKRRTNYDLALMREMGYCNGIENYSRPLSGRKPGEPPDTLLSYFPKKADGSPDFLTVIDESHVTMPQISGMHEGDRSRKQNLVAHGFRLPSALDNRPLRLKEFEERVGQVIYTSATPSDYEREKSASCVSPVGPAKKLIKHSVSDKADGEKKEQPGIVEQIIRPTGLVDPELVLKPVVAKGQHQGQIQDFIAEAVKEIEKGNRVIATTLTKKMAEDLALYLKEKGIKAEYLHSDVKTIERIQILTNFRKGPKNGGFECLVGVNLLREGLDLPEVTLIGILDADKEGFLRSETSLIQTIGRAARNIHGRVILYADVVTGSLKRAIDETNRRREIQLAHNKKHGITPKTIIKAIKDITEELESIHNKAVASEVAFDEALFKKDPTKLLKLKEKQMNAAVKILDFETAALLRDEIKILEKKLAGQGTETSPKKK